MGSEPRVDPRRKLIDLPVFHKFKLYSTRTNFYLIGRDENKTFWRVLKIDRTDPYELNLFEDPTIYTNDEIRELRRCISQGNEKYGGLKAETTCYGIIGFVKFLGPYYMLVIKKRKKVGEICGHTVYGIKESETIMIPYPSSQTKVANYLAEERYKKLLGMVDLTKNFYFSYTYHLMYCLQMNVLNTEKGNIHDNTMFVWNAHLTRGIRRMLKNTIWTVALIYGFFQQTKCSVSGEEFVLTVIARRSRHYAGTRYLRRGVNDVGRVANGVETEQIVSKEVREGQKIPIASVVQVRGSIPLYWSQEISMFTPQPEIILNKKDATYMVTQQHFENMRKRYGKQIIILNLLKTDGKKSRESTLRAEFVKAILFINSGLTMENRLKAIHFDLSKEFKSGADDAFEHLCTFARKSLELTDLFFCKAPSGVGAEGVIHDSFSNFPLSNQDEEALEPDIDNLQKGVLRTNCIDCLDRTNFAQYAHGLVALAHQLHTMGITGPPVVDINNPLAIELMEIYQNMGDTLAMQYGGSAAHIKMFNALKGDRNILRKQRDIFTAVHRFFSNSTRDGEKQNAINLFLGHFRPQLGKPALWELDSDQQTIARYSSNLDMEFMKPPPRRSSSDMTRLVGDLNLEDLVPENPQPSREGLNAGTSEIDTNFSLYETEPASLSFRFSSVTSCEGHLRGRGGSSQTFPGSFSDSDSYKPEDIPGFAHSYDTKFTPADELYELSSSSSWASDNINADLDELIAFLNDINANYEFNPRERDQSEAGDVAEEILVPGYSNEFTRWVWSGTTL